jgi:hypothetical protein
MAAGGSGSGIALPAAEVGAREHKRSIRSRRHAPDMAAPCSSCDILEAGATEDLAMNPVCPAGRRYLRI